MISVDQQPTRKTECCQKHSQFVYHPESEGLRHATQQVSATEIFPLTFVDLHWEFVKEGLLDERAVTLQLLTRM